jgi:ABC-2 type transport system ATP-binding protein
MSFIQIQNLTKQYGKFLALDDFSSEISENQIVGLLGPNGAGKSTFLRMLVQIYTPTSGQILIENEKLLPHHRHLFGYLPEDKGLYQDVSLIDQLKYIAELKGLNTQKAHKESYFWLEKFKLQEYAKKRIQSLSKGMQQKIQFITAVIHNPKVVILDEPLSGLDPVNSQIINEYILEAKERGQLVIFSTHRMEQAQELCNSILMINKGKKVLDGDLQEIKKAHFKDTYLVKFSNQIKTLEYLQKHPQVEILEQNREQNEFQIKLNKIDINKITQDLCQLSNLQQVQTLYPSINQIFIQYVS